jgi:hypothetical protein
MLKTLLCRTLPLAFLALVSASGPAFAEDPAAAPPAVDDAAVAAQTQWTAYGFHVTAPASMWPMLEILHAYHFDWELYSVQTRPTPLQWSPLPPGVYGQYVRSQNVVKLSSMLQSESPELGASFLAHELTHLNDDLNGRLGDATGDACYAAETRAFVNEANYWQMVWGPQGKPDPDTLEASENAKMFAFVGNSDYADLVLRTTASYVKQCGS